MKKRALCSLLTAAVLLTAVVQQVSAAAGMEQPAAVSEVEPSEAEPSETDPTASASMDAKQEQRWKNGASYYYYNLLNEKEKEFWDGLDAACWEVLTTDAQLRSSEYGTYTPVVMNDLPVAEKEKVIDYFSRSNPQYFFLTGLVSETDTFAALMLAKEWADGQTRRQAVETMWAKMEGWYAQIEACDTEYEKVKKIHEIIQENTISDNKAPYSWSAYGGVVYGKTVCSGSAQLFDLLCNSVGLDSFTVTSERLNHAWNMVRVNGTWYFSDTFFDNNAQDQDAEKRPHYNYFLRSGEVFQHHGEVDEWCNPLPESPYDSQSVSLEAFPIPEAAGTVSAPVITISGESAPFMVEIAPTDEASEVYYSLNGAEPEKLYTGAFPIAEEAEIKAAARRDTYWNSPVQEVKVHLIAFDGNGAAGEAEKLVWHSGLGKVEIPANSFTRKGYQFIGWNTKTDGTGISYPPGQQMTAAEAEQLSMLYAQWEIKNYTITYCNMEGAVNHPDNPAAYTVTQAVTLKEPTKAGYRFQGWYTSADFSRQVTGLKAGNAGNAKFYAKWEITQGTGTDTDRPGTDRPGTDEPGTDEPSTDKPSTDKPDTEKPGTGPGGTDTKPTERVSRITYSLNKGVNNKSNPKSYDTEDVVLKNPTRKNYQFKGWYTDSKFKTKITVIKAAAKKNYTLYAKWAKVTSKVTAVTSAKNSKGRQIALGYKKIPGVRGYEISYTTDKNLKNHIIRKTTTKTRYTIKSLKKGKTYYIRVRTYKTDSKGLKVYSSYSKGKKIKVVK